MRNACKSLIFLFFLATSIGGGITPSQAKVCFIVGGCGEEADNEKENQDCASLGYVDSCPQHQVAGTDTCRSMGKEYFKCICDPNYYNLTSEPENSKSPIGKNKYTIKKCPVGERWRAECSGIYSYVKNMTKDENGNSLTTCSSLKLSSNSFRIKSTLVPDDSKSNTYLQYGGVLPDELHCTMLSGDDAGTDRYLGCSCPSDYKYKQGTTGGYTVPAGYCTDTANVKWYDSVFCPTNTPAESDCELTTHQFASTTISHELVAGLTTESDFPTCGNCTCQGMSAEACITKLGEDTSKANYCNKVGGTCENYYKFVPSNNSCPFKFNSSANEYIAPAKNLLASAVDMFKAVFGVNDAMALSGSTATQMTDVGCSMKGGRCLDYHGNPCSTCMTQLTYADGFGPNSNFIDIGKAIDLELGEDWEGRSINIDMCSLKGLGFESKALCEVANPGETCVESGNTGYQTCYNVSPGCPDGYRKDISDEDRAVFTYAAHETHTICYKATGCKSPWKKVITRIGSIKPKRGATYAYEKTDGNIKCQACQISGVFGVGPYVASKPDENIFESIELTAAPYACYHPVGCKAPYTADAPLDPNAPGITVATSGALKCYTGGCTPEYSGDKIYCKECNQTCTGYSAEGCKTALMSKAKEDATKAYYCAPVEDCEGYYTLEQKSGSCPYPFSSSANEYVAPAKNLLASAVDMFKAVFGVNDAMALGPTNLTVMPAITETPTKEPDTPAQTVICEPNSTWWANACSTGAKGYVALDLYGGKKCCKCSSNGATASSVNDSNCSSNVNDACHSKYGNYDQSHCSTYAAGYSSDATFYHCAENGSVSGFSNGKCYGQVLTCPDGYSLRKSNEEVFTYSPHGTYSQCVQATGCATGWTKVDDEDDAPDGADVFTEGDVTCFKGSCTYATDSHGNIYCQECDHVATCETRQYLDLKRVGVAQEVNGKTCYTHEDCKIGDRLNNLYSDDNKPRYCTTSGGMAIVTAVSSNSVTAIPTEPATRINRDSYELRFYLNDESGYTVGSLIEANKAKNKISKAELVKYADSLLINGKSPSTFASVLNEYKMSDSTNIDEIVDEGNAFDVYIGNKTPFGIWTTDGLCYYTDKWNCYTPGKPVKYKCTPSYKNGRVSYSCSTQNITDISNGDEELNGTYWQDELKVPQNYVCIGARSFNIYDDPDLQCEYVVPGTTGANAAQARDMVYTEANYDDDYGFIKPQMGVLFGKVTYTRK